MSQNRPDKEIQQIFHQIAKIREQLAASDARLGGLEARLTALEMKNVVFGPIKTEPAYKIFPFSRTFQRDIIEKKDEIIS